jgi:arabinogalactan oligomer/maltooligosaccharide transport system permease protein
MTRIRQRCRGLEPMDGMPHRAALKSRFAAALALAVTLLAGCGQQDSRRVVNLWHQMRPEDRAVLAERIDAFEAEHPGLLVRPLYKETEELRSGLVSAVLADRGPEVIYGPSDVLGVYQAMGALADMSPWLTNNELDAFDPRAIIRMPAPRHPNEEELIFLGDRFGNHLGLVYNRDFLKEPPKTTDELVALAKANTVDEDGDGRPDRYGLVWNYTEPFFVVPFLTGYGGWIFSAEQGPDGRAIPTLDSPELVRGFEFVQSLVREHKVLPRSADYEVAASLFRDGKAAMIIDGDWSWQQYIEQAEGDAALATLPVVSATGLPMKPTVAPKGYSLGSFAKGQAADDAMELIKFLTSEETQRVFLEKQRILPSRLALRDDPLVTGDPIMATSLLQAEQGRPMPTAVEMRAVWDAMRPPYQLLMAGEIDSEVAAARMQNDALMRIDAMRAPPAPAATQTAAYAIVSAIALGLLFWQRHSIATFFRDLRTNRLAYVMVLPAMALIFLTVLYPLAYNIVLSFSNMSLTNLRDWDIVGFRNYAALATGREAGMFWRVFVKTIFWTVINVAFHVSIGVLLAVTLNGPVRGKSIYRVLLVIPWAVPAYITALTWRGMFDYEYGAVNHAIHALSWVNGFLPTFLQLEPVNWLGQAGPAFIACIIANVWLGFPFMMVIALGGLQGIPAELYEAARIDRASRWQQFRLITLPMLRPVLAPAITLGAVWTFNNLNVVWLVSNGGEPADQTHILVSYVYKAVFNLYQYGYGAALSMVIFFTLLAFSLLFLNRTRATEAV